MEMRPTTNRRQPTASQDTWVHTFHMCVPMYPRLAQHNARMLNCLKKRLTRKRGGLYAKTIAPWLPVVQCARLRQAIINKSMPFARSTRALATRTNSEHCQPSRSMHLAHRNHGRSPCRLTRLSPRHANFRCRLRAREHSDLREACD